MFAPSCSNSTWLTSSYLQVFNFIQENSMALDSAILYDRDYSYDYFGFKTLERSYLLRIDGKIVERPQHLVRFDKEISLSLFLVFLFFLLFHFFPFILSSVTVFFLPDHACCLRHPLR
jgi:hypothetical protein